MEEDSQIMCNEYYDDDDHFINIPTINYDENNVIKDNEKFSKHNIDKQTERSALFI
jgi:hypothetical protein